MDSAASIAQIVDKAGSSWLKNQEVLELLQGYAAAGLSVCQEPPLRPEGGQLFLFDRRVCRFFRRDGHNWRKKPDGKTIRETHEKLKVGNTETLNCYYAHADQVDGLQRRCYWQLDPEREHIVLVHYLCCSSSRAGPAPRPCPAEQLPQDELRERPRRSRRNSQCKLSPLAQSSGSLDSSVPSQLGDVVVGPAAAAAASLDVADAEAVSLGALPLVQGMSLEEAAALPSLAQQYRLQQLLQTQARTVAAAIASPLTALPTVDLDPFDLPADDLSRPHPGVLYTGQRMASQLAAAQQAAATLPAGLQLPPLPLPLAALPAVQAQGQGPSLRPPFQQESYTFEQHRNLFREMSLGIQRETVEEASGYILGSPDRNLDPLVAVTAVGDHGDQTSKVAGSAAAAVADAGAGNPPLDLAALLSSPVHGGGHRRTFSRQGSGLSRLISKNWESELPMDMMLPDVDADISTYPVDGGVVDATERPSSPSSRIFDQAGIAFLGSASIAASTAHTLEPSPLGIPGLGPVRGPTASAADPLSVHAASPPRPFPPFASPLDDGGSGAGTPTFGSPPAQLLFAAGDGASLAQRASRERPGRRDVGAGPSMRRDMGLVGSGGLPRTGSHPHLVHLSRRSGSGGACAEATPEEVEAQQRRQERMDAAAVAAQGHRDEALAAARSRRAAHSSEDAEEEALEMIDVPENMQRLSSFLSRGRQLTGGRELAAMAAEEAARELETQTRSLFKNMSIDEADAVAAVAAAKELDVMPTIHADGSSELEVTRSGLGSMRGSLSEELASRDQSVCSFQR